MVRFMRLISRETIAVALIVERNHLFAQDAVQVVGIPGIVNIHIGMAKVPEIRDFDDRANLTLDQPFGFDRRMRTSRLPSPRRVGVNLGSGIP